jgi:hypothetical protein
MTERNTTGSKNIDVLGEEELSKVVGGWGGARHQGGGMRKHGGGGMRRQGGGNGGGGGQRRGNTIVFIFVNRGVINNGTITGDVVNNSNVDL